MAQKSQFGIADILLVGLILALAAGLRTGYLVRCADNASQAGAFQVQDSPPPLHDVPSGTTFRAQSAPTELDALVENLSTSRWFGSLAPFAPREEKTAHTAPGYPWLLSLLSPLTRGGDLDLLVRWLQCGLGTLTVGCYYLLALRVFGSRTVACFTGILCACHPFWILNTAAINDGVLTTFLLAFCCLMGARASATSGPFASFLFGLTLAGLSLVRAAMLPFAFVALLWFLLRSRKLERGWLCGLLAFLGMANGLAPWTLRNFQTFNEPVPIVNTAFLHLWMGSNALANGGPQSEEQLLEALVKQRREKDAANASTVETLRKELESKTSQSERYRTFARPVGEAIRAHPGRFLENRLQAAICFLLGEQWLAERRMARRTASADELPRWMVRYHEAILQGTVLLMLGLGLLGWRWTARWQHDAMPTVLALIWVPLPYVLTHAEVLSGPRLPLDGILLLYTAFALGCLCPGLARYLFDGTAGLGPTDRNAAHARRRA